MFQSLFENIRKTLNVPVREVKRSHLGVTLSIDHKKSMTNLQIQMSVVLSYNYLYIYIFLISSVIGSVVNIVVQIIGFYLTATSMKRVQYKGTHP